MNTFNYLIRGFNSRAEYLQSIAKQYNVSIVVVEELAFIMGDEADFDALLCGVKIMQEDENLVKITIENEFLLIPEIIDNKQMVKIPNYN